jgi:hypothetical protein
MFLLFVGASRKAKRDSQKRGWYKQEWVVEAFMDPSIASSEWQGKFNR